MTRNPFVASPATPSLSPTERRNLRDEIALRVLPFCCLVCRDDTASLKQQAERATQRAYIIADEMLAARIQ